VTYVTVCPVAQHHTLIFAFGSNASIPRSDVMLFAHFVIVYFRGASCLVGCAIQRFVGWGTNDLSQGQFGVQTQLAFVLIMAHITASHIIRQPLRPSNSSQSWYQFADPRGIAGLVSPENIDCLGRNQTEYFQIACLSGEITTTLLWGGLVYLFPARI